MLVLTRMKEESVKIGSDIEVRVVSIQGDKVLLGITAPPDVPVHRDEIYAKVHGLPAPVRTAGVVRRRVTDALRTTRGEGGA